MRSGNGAVVASTRKCNLSAGDIILWLWNTRCRQVRHAESVFLRPPREDLTGYELGQSQTAPVVGSSHHESV